MHSELASSVRGCPLVITSCRERAPTGFGAKRELSELRLLAPHRLACCCFRSCCCHRPARISPRPSRHSRCRSFAGGGTIHVRQRMRHATSRRRRLFPRPRRAHSLARFQAGSFEPKPPPSLTPVAPRDSLIPPLATDPSQPLPLAAAQHRAQVSDDYVAPVTLGVGRGAQTFLLVADTGSNPNPNPNPNRLPQPEPWPSWPWP